MAERTASYASPLGELCLCADGDVLTGLWFVGQRYFRRGHESAEPAECTGVLAETCAWLDAYFAKKPLPPMPKLRPAGTDFQRRVFDELCRIPYGETLSYGALAARLGVSCARAIGAAVGKNPISILIPCHRVVGANGALTGYAGGTDKKAALLSLEKGGE